MTTLAPSSARARTMAKPMPLFPPVTMATLPVRVMRGLLVVRPGRSSEPPVQVLTDADGVGHGGEGWVHRTDAREEAGVHDVEVVELVGLAIGVEHRCRRVVTEAAGAGLMGDPGHRDVHVH